MKAGGWENVIKVIADSESLLQNTLEGREDKVAVALDHALCGYCFFAAAREE